MDLMKLYVGPLNITLDLSTFTTDNITKAAVYTTRNAAFQSTRQSTGSLKQTRMDDCSFTVGRILTVTYNLRLLVADRQSQNEIQ